MADYPLIQTKKLGKVYHTTAGDYTALSDITLKIQKKEFVAIMGPSGSGKSTLMHILGALDSATSGEYIFHGKNITTYSEDQLAEIRNKEIGFVFQAFNVLPRMSVFKNVELPMVYGGIDKREREKYVMRALKDVGIDDKKNSLSNQLSGGQLQRVAIARALVMNPSLILADEPTGNLDTHTSHEVMHLLEKMNASGKTVVLITHEHDMAKYAQRIVKLMDGKIVSDIKNKKTI